MPSLHFRAHSRNARTHESVKKTFWLAGRGFYAVVTNQPPVVPRKAEPGALRLLLEGRGRRTYTLHLKTPYNVGDPAGFNAKRVAADDFLLTVSFEASTGGYQRRELVIPLVRR